MALAVPNFSAGRDPGTIASIAAAFAPAALLDRHSDGAHNRTVLTLGAADDEIVAALVSGAAACIEWIDMPTHTGEHPCIGALDVCPLVYRDEAERATARELVGGLARELASLGLPVFLYGELASAPERRERAWFRRGGFEALAGRMRSGELVPDFGPPDPHPSAGAVLVTARPPLAAFNLELDTPSLAIASLLASELRETGGGIPGVRAIAVDLGDRAQVSTNIHDPAAVPLAAVIERVRELAGGLGAAPIAAEIVGLVPEAGLTGLPIEGVPIPGFDLDRVALERRWPLADQPPT